MSNERTEAGERWRIAALTYNVNRQISDSSINSRIHEWLDKERAIQQCDIVAIGVQELPASEWVFNAIPQTWASNFNSWMCRHQLILLHSVSLASNLLLVYTRARILPFVRCVDSRWTRDHFYGLTGYKGTVATKLLFKDFTSQVFMTSHFFHGEKFSEHRIKQHFKSLPCTFEGSGGDPREVRMRRLLLWMGDFNSRTEGFENSTSVIKAIEGVPDGSEKLDAMVSVYDQLRKSMDGKRAFVGFNEPRITFKPTYKLKCPLVVKLDSGLYADMRIPSWCDRVLYKGSLQVEQYSSYRNITLSDHFPVVLIATTEAPTSADRLGWDVEFDYIPTWSNTIPLFCRFAYCNDFWKEAGSYRDWVAIYPADIQSVPSPVRWISVTATYEDYNKRAVVEFPQLDVGSYRVAYFSRKRNCLVGISGPFTVKVEKHRGNKMLTSPPPINLAC